MSKASGAHFDAKKLNTAIKHLVLKITLEGSISIANRFSQFISGDKEQIYTYIDLYAGTGAFEEDNKNGSPIIALDSFFFQQNTLNFKKTNLIFIEKDEERSKALEENIEGYMKTKGINHNLNILTLSGGWEEFLKILNKYITQSTWGFIFADPFSNEFDVEKFSEIFNQNKYGKNMLDILIFVNMQDLRRCLAYEKTKQKVLNFLKIDEKYFTDGKESDYDDTIREALTQRFSILNKDFNIGIAIPNSREGHLTNSDYFYLVLLTNSTGVAKNFLESYVKAKQEFDRKPPKLFQESISDVIIDITREAKNISLYEVVRNLFNRYLSWKDADINEIPTDKNIQKALNEIIKKGIISANSIDKDLLKIKGVELKGEAFRNKTNQSKITLSIAER